jgi:hypothetical protein
MPKAATDACPYAHYFFVDNPRGKYAGHQPIAAVTIGTSPITPHQLWEYQPAAQMATPTTIRITRSVEPTFNFMVIPP